jgi:hypothetical protein
MLDKLVDKVKLFFVCVRRIDLRHTLKLTIQSAFPCGLEPVSLLVSPITFPFLFVLRLYEQYCIEKVIVSLQKLTSLLDTILGPVKAKEDTVHP